MSRFLIHQRNQVIQCHSRRYTLENTEDKLKIQTIQKLNTTQKQTAQNTTTLVQLSLMKLGQDTRWAHTGCSTCSLVKLKSIKRNIRVRRGRDTDDYNVIAFDKQSPHILTATHSKRLSLTLCWRHSHVISLLTTRKVNQTLVALLQ